MKRLLVAGVRGMLGTRVAAFAPAGWAVTGIDIEECDITGPEETFRVVGALRPHVLVNCAAMTDVDGCESREEAAMAVNGRGAGNLAAAAREAGAAVLHVSTDYVFDGTKKGEYIEDDPPAPLGVYGRSKLLGEELVRRENPRHWIVRTQWLYGPGGRNFVDTILKLSAERSRLEVVNDQIGCPTCSVDLARRLLLIAGEGLPYGTYHCSSRGSCSWFELARRIVALAGRDRVLVVPITSDRLDRPAPRPPRSILRNKRLEETVGDDMPHWSEALEAYMISLGFGKGRRPAGRPSPEEGG